MKLRNDTNEYGTPITVFECEYCGSEFSVCPAVGDDKLDNWSGCLAPECESYDPSRDVDALLFFGAVELGRTDDNPRHGRS